MEKETTLPATHTIQETTQTTCCIVGGGPAGVMLALLLARKDVPVVLLEAHMDFDREFRGDTIHPSVLNILDELGLADRMLQETPHTEMRQLAFDSNSGPVQVANFELLKVKYPYVALLPQVAFLNFIIAEARRYPHFQLVMGAQVDELIEENGKICGVRYRGRDGWSEVRALLTVGTDGRFSRVRKLAGFEPIKTAPPMDVLWFRLSRRANDPDETFGHFGQSSLLIVLNRLDYWQLGYIIPKGGYQTIRAAGLEKFRQGIAGVLPEFADRVAELQEWKQLSVLSVESSRLSRWYRPGLLLIGDAAHVMSPVGGVGINYAIQDAVVTANVLGNKLKYGVVQQQDLASIQRQRELPVRVIQAFQGMIQNRVLSPALKTGNPVVFPPVLGFFRNLPFLRRLPPLLVGFGLWPAHVKD